MSRIESGSFSQPTFDQGMRQSSAGAGGMASSGNLGGQKVTVDKASSILTDAAEEISLHHSEKAEAKHSAERKKEVDQAVELMAPEAIQAYLDAAQQFDDAEKLAHLAKRMLSGMGDPGTQAREGFKEPTGQFLALQYALHQGENEGASADILDNLRAALDDLDMEHGPRIRADINTITTAAQGTGSAGEVADFQATYRDVVLGDSSLAGTLKLAIERFGEDDFAAGLGKLTAALGQDLASARPSTDPARLQSLVQDLYHLGVAVTVLDGCRELQSVQARKFGTPAMNPAALMQDLVAVSSEKWVAATRFTHIAERFGAGDVHAQIGFLTGVKTLLRDMPVKVFADAEQRQSVFQAVQQALDTAIDREDS